MRALIALMVLTWVEKTPLPVGRAGGAAALIGDDLVLAGGTFWDGDLKKWLDSVLLYDTRTERWRDGPPLPAPLAYGAYTQTKHGLEIFGGNDSHRNHRESWALDAQKRRWVQTGLIPDDRLLGAAVRIGANTFLLGGCPDIKDLTRCTDSVLVRNDEGPWRNFSAMPHGRISLPAAAVVRGRIYLFGGCSMLSPGKIENSRQAYSFDPGAKTWRRLRDLPEPNRGPSAAAYKDRYIFLFGGYTSSDEDAPRKPDLGYSRSVLIYDVETDTYRNTTPLPAGLMGTDFFLHGDKFYGAGGEDRTRRSRRLLAGRLEADPEVK